MKSLDWRFHPGIKEHGLTKRQAYARIRRATSWDELISMMRELGYELFPAEEDVFGIDLTSRDVIYLGDSGHFFPFLVERLGAPPPELRPTGFYKLERETRAHKALKRRPFFRRDKVPAVE